MVNIYILPTHFPIYCKVGGGGHIVVILWILTLFTVGLISLPIFRKYHVSCLLGLVLVTYITWIVSNLIDLKDSVFYGFLIYTFIGVFVWFFTLRKDFKKLLLKYIRFYLIFLFFFIVYVLYVMFDPNIFGGEKMTEIAILNGVLKSDKMPPIDVNLAGFRFDFYYYMGYVLVGFLTVLSNVDPSIAFNLALATFFAFVLSLIVDFSKRNNNYYLPLFLLSGNLMSFVVLIESLFGFKDFKLAFDFWTVTRVIPNTINEFPFATLTFRDLHPHFMGLAFQVLFLILLYEWFKERRDSILLTLMFLLGFMYTVNTWDFFTYSFLLAIVLLFHKEYKFIPLIPVVSLIPFLPFHLSLKSTAVNGISVVTQRTSIQDFLIAQPLILIPLAYSVINERKLAVPLILASIPIAIAFNFQILPILAPILIVFTLKLRNRRFEDFLIVTATLIFIAVEILCVNDAYSGKLERLNTVFKTYVQAWVLLSFGNSILLKNDTRFLRLFAIVLIVLLWIYPVGYIATKASHGFTGSLDGMEFTKVYGEYNALKFLQKFKGVVLEYPGKNPFESYTYSGRVSAFTGLSSVICNGGHELFWRYFNKTTTKILLERWNDVNKIYSSRDLNSVEDLLKKYNVNYIYVGYLERKNYNSTSLKKFEKLKKIYDDGNVVVYTFN